MSKTLDLGPITAYAIAVKNGFVGTEQEWLESLKCSSVTDEQVSSAVDAYLESHPDATVPDGSISEAKLAQDVKDKFSSLSEEIANIGGGTGTGAPGPAGADGVGIQSVEQTTTSTEDGGTNVVTVTKTDGTSSTFAVRNGSRGSSGPAGADGQPGADGKDGLDGSPGADGKSAYQYAQDGGYTGTEEEFAAKLAAEIPDTLPNPNTLTFSGAVTGSYDGSEPLTVEIPSGGGAAEREWTKLGEIDVSVAGGGSIELTDLDNFTEFYATWKNMVNESTTASGYALKINDTGIAQSVIMIQRSGTASSYGWMIAKYNGLVWEVQRSSGTISSSNITLSGNNVPYNLFLGVGKAVKFKLEAPALAYQAISGIITIYGR